MGILLGLTFSHFFSKNYLFKHKNLNMLFLLHNCINYLGLGFHLKAEEIGYVVNWRKKRKKVFFV